MDQGNVAREINTIIIEPSTQILILQVRHVQKFVTSSTTFIYRLPSNTIELSASTNDHKVVASVLAPINSAVLSQICGHSLGLASSGIVTSRGAKSLVFIHRNSWLSSIDLSTILLQTSSSDTANIEYTQHIYVPKDYLSWGVSETRPVKTSDDDFVFCSHGELIALKGALKFRDTVVANKLAPRKSM